ncbi:SpoIIE family protein phosphatase [bacterium]|nr:SpoIIE family protein phosphatase [bacterium]
MSRDCHQATRTPPPPLPRGLSFRTTLVLGVCGLVVLTGAAVLGLAHRGARAGTEALTASVFREASGRASAHASGFVSRAVPVVESLAGLADKGLAVDDPERLAPQLLAVLKANPGLSWVSYGDEHGTFTGAYRTPEGGLRVNRSRVVGGRSHLVEHDVRPDGSWVVHRTSDDHQYDPRDRPFYVKAKRERRLVWLPPYVFFSQGIPGVSCAAPVTDAAGRLRGVLSVDFDLNALSAFVSDQVVSEHSRVFLFTADGNVLAYPGWHRSGAAGGRGELVTLTAAAAGDPVMAAYHIGLRPEFLRPATGDGFHRFEFSADETDYLGSTTAFRVGDDLVWVVGVAAPKADFVGDIWRTQAVALTAAALAVLAAAALAVALAGAVSRPVQALIGFMRRVGGGDLEARAEFGGRGEFRELAAELNRMIADLRDRLRLRHSLGVAMEVQQRLLPAAAPAVAGLDVAGHSTYCDETGGDYYDFLVLDAASSGTILVALGDVMGHGVAAALVMAGVRAVLRDRAVAPGDLAGLMGRLNRLIAADHGGDRFMTMHLSVVDVRTRTVRWVSAGHDPVIVYDPADGSFVDVGEGDLPLGVMDDTAYAEQTAGPFRPGQLLFYGTDGVWEMPDGRGEQFGKDRLREVLRESISLPADGIAKAVRERLTAFRGNAKSVDDVTFVVVKFLS